MNKGKLVQFMQPFTDEAELVVKDVHGTIIDITELMYDVTESGIGKIVLLLPQNFRITANAQITIEETDELVMGTTEPVLTKSKEYTFVVWVDGACSGNPGPGGWAYTIQKIGAYANTAGREEVTTNQKMELKAALEALQKCTSLSASLYGKEYRPTVKIHSDSEYVVKTMNLEFHGKANLELISKLKEVCLLMTVEWVHVPRNSCSQMEFCDSWAKKASKTPNFKRAVIL